MINLTQFTANEWRSEAANGFPTLKAIPSSTVQAQLAVMLEHGYDIDFMMRKAQRRISREALDSFLHLSFMKMTSPRFMGYREARQYLRDPNHNAGIIRDIIEKDNETIKALLDRLTIPTAREMRKALFPTIQGAANSAPEDFGGGVWRFPLIRQGNTIWLYVDFGGRHSGFRWYFDFRGSD